MVLIDKTYLEERFGLDNANKRAVEAVPSCDPTKLNNRYRPRFSRPSQEVIEDSNKAYEKGLLLLSHRDRSQYEITQRLLGYGFGQDAIDEAVHRFIVLGFIDDARFADNYIRSKVAVGMGTRGIIAALRDDHNIDAYAVPGFPDEFRSTEDEVAQAVALLLKKPPRSKNPANSAYAKLVRKGFSNEIAHRATKQWMKQSESVRDF